MVKPSLALVDGGCDALVRLPGSFRPYRCSRQWTSVRATRKGHAHVCSQHARAKRIAVAVPKVLKARLHTDPVPRHGCAVCESAAKAA